MKDKYGPSGMSKNIAYSMPEKWGGVDQLLPVDLDLIRAMKQELGGDAILEFVSEEFSRTAEAAYERLGVVELTFHNIWDVFSAMLPLVFP